MESLVQLGGAADSQAAIPPISFEICGPREEKITIMDLVLRREGSGVPRRIGGDSGLEFTNFDNWQPDGTPLVGPGFLLARFQIKRTHAIRDAAGKIGIDVAIVNGGDSKPRRQLSTACPF